MTRDAARRRASTRAFAGAVCVAALVAGGLALQAQSRAADQTASRGAEGTAYDAAIPDDVVLLEQLEEAVELRRREDFDRVLDARDPGELIEHATLTEMMFERAPIGIEALFIVGDELFGYLFRPENGWGGGDGDRQALDYTPRLRRVHRGPAGGPDAFACMSCHFKGGPDGAGMQTQNALLFGDGERVDRADARNPPHLLGLGPVAAPSRAS